MKTLILYYSLSGNTRKVAEALAESEPADIAEIKSAKRIGKLKAYTAGIFGAIGGKAWPIAPLDTDLSGYERLILLSPVWANNPAPPVNAILQQLPEGKTIAVKLISASGKSDCTQRLETAITEKGCTLESVEDISSRK